MQDNILQTAERALVILELLGEAPMTATEIGKKLNLNKTTVHRLMMTLLSRGFVERKEDTGVYQIGLKLIELSSIRLNKIELKTEADPYLRQLANRTNQSVQLAIFDNDEAVYIAKVDRFTSIHMYSQIGKRIPIYCSAVGKSLVLDMDDADIKAMLDKQVFKAFTEKTPKTSGVVLEEIRAARRTGYTYDNEEHELGIFCVGTPIRDYRGQIAAAISLAGFDSSVIGNPDHPLALELRNAAVEISKRMGYVRK